MIILKTKLSGGLSQKSNVDPEISVKFPLQWACLKYKYFLGAALGPEARTRGGNPRVRRGSVGAGKRGGVLGAEGVARVVSDRLPAMRQPLRVG